MDGWMDLPVISGQQMSKANRCLYKSYGVMSQTLGGGKLDVWEEV